MQAKRNDHAHQKRAQEKSLSNVQNRSPFKTARSSAQIDHVSQWTCPLLPNQITEQCMNTTVIQTPPKESWHRTIRTVYDHITRQSTNWLRSDKNRTTILRKQQLSISQVDTQDRQSSREDKSVEGIYSQTQQPK